MYDGGGEGVSERMCTDLVRRIHKGIPLELHAEVGSLLPISARQCKDGIGDQVDGFAYALRDLDRRLPAVERLRLRKHVVVDNVVQLSRTVVCAWLLLWQHLAGGSHLLHVGGHRREIEETSSPCCVRMVSELVFAEAPSQGTGALRSCLVHTPTSDE